MKIYPVFLIILMMINFGLMAYLQKKTKALWFILLPFLFYVFSFLFDFYPSLQKQEAYYVLPLGFFGILLFVYLKKYSFNLSYFLLCWIICLRFLTKTLSNELEQSILEAIIGGGFFIYLSWVSLIALHKSKIQKIALFCMSNYILAFLLMCIAYLYNQESTLKQIENIKEFSIASLFFVIPFVGTILSSIIAYPICYLGEILLFLLLCYQLLLKDSKNPNPPTP